MSINVGQWVIVTKLNSQRAGMVGHVVEVIDTNSVRPNGETVQCFLVQNPVTGDLIDLMDYEVAPLAA
jgi:hypothetical protein